MCKAWMYCEQVRRTWDDKDANEVEDFDLMEEAASVQKGVMEVGNGDDNVGHTGCPGYGPSEACGNSKTSFPGARGR